MQMLLVVLVAFVLAALLVMADTDVGKCIEEFNRLDEIENQAKEALLQATQENNQIESEAYTKAQEAVMEQAKKCYSMYFS